MADQHQSSQGGHGQQEGEPGSGPGRGPGHEQPSYDPPRSFESAQDSPYGQGGQPGTASAAAYQAAPVGPPVQPSGYAFGAPPYAGWLTRVGAYLLDFLPNMLLLGVAAVLSGHGPVATAIALACYLASLGWNIYNRWVRAGRTGQSLGKSVTGVRLISQETGRPIGGGRAFVRDLAHFLDGILCYVGYLFPLWDFKGQTLADKIMRTVVVKNGTGSAHADGQGYGQHTFGQPGYGQQMPGGYGSPQQ